MSDMPAANESSSATSGTAGHITAGGLLRQARQAQGLHIAALAAAIKVVPRKLELLESDQYAGLPDATFTRALAQAVCRHLKVDAAPVLALLPPPNGHRLERVSEGLKTTFHERPGRFVPRNWASVSSAALWLAARIENRLGNRAGVRDFGEQLRRRFPDSREFISFQQGNFDE